MKSFVVLVVFVAACVTSSSAIRCYNCVFPGDPKCGDDLKDIQATECTELSVEKTIGVKSVCMKAVVNIGGTKSITRSCSKQGGQYNACSAFKDNVEHCSVCEEDLCNGSSHLLMNIWSTFIPVAIALFIKFF
ncbi:CLUMA_CG017613, isoform A [Clunio marinus]|uniref:CLUMA_CG017613, isoform A n=1 Tax=Clunio marinus TaxID=568069 RepID=A0A1J1IYA5_9DIPT|nr:CLUMA_CG017613, isoform A [Clunio marinus]